MGKLKNWGLRFVCFLIRGALKLRYSIKFKGLDLLNDKYLKKGNGILFLPNHPALVDPVIVMSKLWPMFEMRPLVKEYLFRSSILRRFFNIVGAYSIPDFRSINEIKLKSFENTMKNILSDVQSGGSLLLYPTGSLKSSGQESIHSSSTHRILEHLPNINVVLIRTTGLWGSTFSRAFEQKTPGLSPAVFQALKTLCLNLFFFCRRREVIVEIEPNPINFPRNSNRSHLNHYLETWYNHYPLPDNKRALSEPLNMVSLRFWKNVYPEILPKKKSIYEVNAANIPENIKNEIYNKISEITGINTENISPDLSLTSDLGLDSIDGASLASFAMERFHIANISPASIDTVEDLLAISAGYSKQGEKYETKHENDTWPFEADRLEPCIDKEASTLLEAFLSTVRRMKGSSAVADQISGVFSYSKFHKAAIALAIELKKREEKQVAILLPSICASYIVIFAAWLAGKTPVMLNWTLGVKHLKESMEQTEANLVISSWTFLENVSHIEFGPLTDKITFIEDIKDAIGLKTKLKTLFYSMLSPKSLLRRFDNKLSKDDVAVILFTSGTEAAPKGVPLTHSNILSNNSQINSIFKLVKSDVILNTLPPFHSFGFSVAGILPIISGVKTVFYPNPTESIALAQQCQRWNVTILPAPPSFLYGLLSHATSSQVESIRYFVSGAEKLQPAIKKLIHDNAPKAKLVEGYGITETAPLIATNFDTDNKESFKLLPNLEVMIVDPEGKELPPNSEGEIAISGPNVFNGYLNLDKNPFLEAKDRKWYRSGDLGIMRDQELILSGRIKRFIKIGGEMVSMASIEKILDEKIEKQAKQENEEQSTRFVICSNEDLTKPILILFTTHQNLDVVKLNEMLRSSGFSALIKISQIIPIGVFPVMGTGKINYRELQSRVKKDEVKTV